MTIDSALWELTERFDGERTIYVYADSKAEALRLARAGESAEEDDPRLFNYRYVGPVTEVL